MAYFLLLVLVSVGWSHNEEEHAAPEAKTEEAPSLDSTIQQLVEGLITDKSIDIGIKSLSMKDSSSSTFQIEGTAGSNANISTLLEALEAESKTSKAYLVSTEKGTVDGKERQVFVLTAEYSAK